MLCYQTSKAPNSDLQLKLLTRDLAILLQVYVTWLTIHQFAIAPVKIMITSGRSLVGPNSAYF